MSRRMNIKETIAKIALEVKEELAKKNYKDKDKELVYIVASSIAKYVQELEKLWKQNNRICKGCPFLGYQGDEEICTIYYKLEKYDLSHLEQRKTNCPIKDIRKWK